jgi:hypothetical protein
MRQRSLLLFTLLVSACSAIECEPISGAELTLNFDGPGAMEHVSVLSGQWGRVQDSSAPSGGHAIAQQAKGVSADFNLLLAETFNAADVDVSLSFQAMSGEIDQGGGPVWRAVDQDNYYVARYNPLEDNYRVYTVKGGKRTELQSADIPNTPGWHSLRITMVGDLICCYYDGQLSLKLHDQTFPAAGRIGLWTKADAQTKFDNLVVK